MNDGSIYCMYRTAGNHPVPRLQPRRRPYLDDARVRHLHPRRTKVQELPGLPEDLEGIQRQVPVLVPSSRSTRESLQGPKPGLAQRRHREGRLHSLVPAGNRPLRHRSPELPVRSEDRYSGAGWRNELPRPDRAGRPLLDHRDPKDARPSPPDRPDAIGRPLEPGRGEEGLSGRAWSWIWGRTSSREAKCPCPAAKPGRGRRLLARLLDHPERARPPARCVVDSRDAIGQGSCHHDHRARHASDRAERRQESGFLGVRPGPSQARHPAPRGGHRRWRAEGHQLRRRRNPLRRRHGQHLRLGPLCRRTGRCRRSRQPRIAPNLRGRLDRLRIYDRYLRTSEAVAHCRAVLVRVSAPKGSDRSAAR